MPGIEVEAGTFLLELSNPELENSLREAEWSLKSTEAELTSQKARLKNQFLEIDSAVARLEANYEEAKLQLEVDQKLFSDGLISGRNMKLSESRVVQLARLIDIEIKRLDINRGSEDAQLAVVEAKVEQARSLRRLKEEQVKSLRVYAGTEEVLEQVKVEAGQRVVPGAILAKVTHPRRLKAVLEIQETQARDLKFHQKVSVDTLFGLVSRHVVRIDPVVINSTRVVDVALDGPLPEGAVPDLSVDGTVEIERLENVLHVKRPALGGANSTISLFKLEADGKHAARTPVKIGRVSFDT